MTTKRTVGERLALHIGTGKPMSVRSFAAAMRARKPRPRGSTRAMVHRYLKGTTTPRSDFIAAAAATLGLNAEWLESGTGHETPGSATVAAIANVSQPAADEWRRTALQIKRAILGTAAIKENKATIRAWVELLDGQRAEFVDGFVRVKSGDSTELVRFDPSRHRVLPQPLTAEPKAAEVIPYWVAPLADLLMTRGLIPDAGIAIKRRPNMTEAERQAASRAAAEAETAAQLKALGSAIRGPLKALGLSPRVMGARAFADYATGMVPVLFGLAASQEQRRKAEAEAGERHEGAMVQPGEGSAMTVAEAYRAVRREGEEQHQRELAAMRAPRKPPKRAPRKRPKARKPSKPASKAKPATRARRKRR